MKKSGIWLLIIVMVLAFSGLLYMQVNYVSVVYKSRNDQFNEAVRKSLSSVNRDIERDEVRRLMEENADLSMVYKDDQISSANPQINIDPKGFKLDQLPTDPFKSAQNQNRDRFLETSRLLQSQLSGKIVYLREMIVELALDMLMNSTETPFYDRVSQKQLESYLSTYLNDNGVTLHYVYEVVDRNGHVYFSSGKIPDNDAAGVYTQALFLNDNPSKLHFLKVYFPDKRQYISSNIDFVLPSIIFTAILFLIFVFTIFIIFRQKKLAELKTDFINNMTHELKTPVSTIILGSQMLRDSGFEKSPKVFNQILTSISDEGNRLNFLIEKVLQMSLFDREKVVFKMKEIDIQEIIISVVNTFSIKAETYGGSVDIDLDAENTSIYADEMHITNVLFNLLENAIKYRREEVPPHLVVGTYNEGQNLCIYIQDNGIGIKKEYLKKVFDRFFRVPTGNVHDVKGFGLGLAYVSKIVHDHGGSIRAESELGKGTKFIINLPLINNN